MALGSLSKGGLLIALFTVPVILLLYAVDFSFVRIFARQKLYSTLNFVTPYKPSHTKHQNGTTPSGLLCPSDDSISFTRNFLYLMQTESCIPKALLSPNVLGDPSVCNCDVLVLGFKSQCTRKYSSHIKHIFQHSTWSTGRKYLYNNSISSRKKYMYYIFMDDDTVLTVNHGNKSRNAWRVFENFLFRLRPPIGISDTVNWENLNEILKLRKDKGCKQSSLEEAVPTMHWDSTIFGFHHEAAKSVLEPILPFWSKFDNHCWWYSHWYVSVMSDVVYHHNNVYNSELMAKSPRHRKYPRRMWVRSIVDEIFADIQSVIPKEFKKKAETVLTEWRTTDLNLRRKNHYSYCLDLPKSCIKPYQYTI